MFCKGLFFVCVLSFIPVVLPAQQGSRIWRPGNKTTGHFYSHIILSDPGASKKESLCMVHAEPVKLAFFCSMENKFRNKFNVYFKLRAGNDEMYRAMISKPGK